MKVKFSNKVRGEIVPPADKSITHRMIFFSAISKGKTRVYNPLHCDDTHRSLGLVRSVGCKVKVEDRYLEIEPPTRLLEPLKPVNCGNSGTTARIGLGLLATGNFFSVLYGDTSLSKRPMKRIVEPLKKLGASLDGRNVSSNLPICVRGGNLHTCVYSSKVPSAQVKSSFIIAAMRANGESFYSEKIRSRDHTERFLSKYGLVDVSKEGIEIHPGKIPSFNVEIVGDFSSAAFFIVLAAIHPNARLKIKRIGLNPTRTGLLEVLKRMGGHVEICRRYSEIEPFGDVEVESSKLSATEVKDKEIPSLVDEIPLVALLGAFAQGETIVHGAGELRKKESDRLKATVQILKDIGADIEELPDGFKLRGGKKLHGAKIKTFGDHRMAMLASVAGICIENIEVENPKCVSISYPNFFSDLEKVAK